MDKIIGTNNDGVFIVRNGICSFIPNREYLSMLEHGVKFESGMTDIGKLCKIFMCKSNYVISLDYFNNGFFSVNVSADIISMSGYRNYYNLELHNQRRYTESSLDYAVFLRVTVSISGGCIDDVEVHNELFERCMCLNDSYVSYVREIPVEFYETLINYGKSALSGFDLSRIVRYKGC